VEAGGKGLSERRKRTPTAGIYRKTFIKTEVFSRGRSQEKTIAEKSGDQKTVAGGNCLRATKGQYRLLKHI